MVSGVILDMENGKRLLRKFGNIDDAVSAPVDLGVVGDEQYGYAEFAREIQEHIHDFLTVCHVEVSGRFVREEKGDFSYECPRDGDSLALSAGEYLDSGILLGQEAYPTEDVIERETSFEAIHLDREHDVFRYGQVIEQEKILEYEPEFVRPKCRTFVIAELRDVGSSDANASRRREVDSGDDVQERGFPASARTDDRDNLGRTDIEREIFQDFQPAFGSFEGFGDVRNGHVVLRRGRFHGKPLRSFEF